MLILESTQALILLLPCEELYPQKHFCTDVCLYQTLRPPPKVNVTKSLHPWTDPLADARAVAVDQ